MEKKKFTIQVLLSCLALILGVGSLSAQITITRDWNPGAFTGEVGWEIVNTTTGVVVDCEQTFGAAPPTAPTNLNVPEGVYEVL